MGYVLLVAITMVAFVGAVICMYYALEPKRKRLEEQEQYQATQARRIQETQQTLDARAQTLSQEEARLNAARAELNSQAVRVGHALENETTRLRASQKEFEARVVSYTELLDENTILKRDLRNIDVNVRKLQLDRELQRQTQVTLDQRAKDLGSRYLKDNVKWIGSSLNPNNFATCKQRMQDVIEKCRGIGFHVSSNEEAALLANLREEYERVVRAAFEREEQARIRAQVREEQLREKELREKERELEQKKRESQALEAALAKALAQARDQHSAEIDQLKAELDAKQAEIDATQRAVSNAQLTKSGHVYVISNIGSFGDNIFKIGMTRRDNPKDRVIELGDASVPFPFDVHMMINSNDAPALENALHRKLHMLRINKTNPRKEFFRTDIEAIVQIVRDHHGEVEYIADAEALQYRQSVAMSEEDQEFIESVYDELDEDNAAGEIDK